MKNIKLHIEYDGTNYSGWQIQNNAYTVQGEIEKAIIKLTGMYSELNGCSRTDKGVHALSHISNFFTESSIPPERFCFALNSILPRDIVVKESCEVPSDFHARFSCIGKKYIYRVYNCNTRSALLRDRAWFEPRPLDTEAMNDAAKNFIGEYDFTAFQAVGSSAKTTVRKMFDASVYKVVSQGKGIDIYFEITGTGFLYNMVRIMTGTLVDVGKGKLKPENIKEIILSCDRIRAGSTAPPHGLYLKEVYYGTI